MAHARKHFLFARRHAETLRRYRNRPAFGIMEANLAMLQIVGLLDDHAAGVEFEKPSFHFFEIVHLQADMMQARLGVHLTEGRTFLEKSKIVVAVGNGNISLRRAAELLRAEKTSIKLDELLRVVGQIGDVAKGCHGSILPNQFCFVGLYASS